MNGVIRSRQIAMSSLNRQQSDRLVQNLGEVEQLLTEVDEEGAEEVLDELYMLITKLFEQFPQLDKEEE
jgi:hypothetical protein